MKYRTSLSESSTNIKILLRELSYPHTLEFLCEKTLIFIYLIIFVLFICLFFSSSRELLHMFELTSVGNTFLFKFKQISRIFILPPT